MRVPLLSSYLSEASLSLSLSLWLSPFWLLLSLFQSPFLPLLLSLANVWFPSSKVWSSILSPAFLMNFHLFSLPYAGVTERKERLECTAWLVCKAFVFVFFFFFLPSYFSLGLFPNRYFIMIRFLLCKRKKKISNAFDLKRWQNHKVETK